MRIDGRTLSHETSETIRTAVFPRLRTRAKRIGAKIFFLDEAGVRSDQVPV